jgi:transcriptional regulator of acetoin/glycerol metabolism
MRYNSRDLMIACDYKAGWLVKRIAFVHGVSRWTVHRVCRQFGLRPRRGA